MTRKRYISDADPFSSVSSSVDTSAAAIADELYGAIRAVDTNRQSASPISITQIEPDPAQPRRAIPWKIRQVWSGDVQAMGDLFSIWVDQVAEERGTPFDLRKHLNADEDIQRPETIGPLENTLLNLIELAVSISNDGLTNPITVVPNGQRYRLETGERRWLAYHLLHLHTGEEKYARIAAKTVESLNIWRQAAENNARANLNAISRARQFAVLLINLLMDKTQISFLPFGTFEIEQDYYAQVADGDQYPIPRNTSERLLTAVGLKNSKQLRDYRRLLRLPNIVWQIADDLDWTEYFIRNLQQQAGDDDVKLLELATQAALQAGYGVPVGTLQRDKGSTTKGVSPAESTVPGSRKHYSELIRLLQKTGPGKVKANQKAFQYLLEIKDWVESEEDRLSKWMSDT